MTCKPNIPFSFYAFVALMVVSFSGINSYGQLGNIDPGFDPGTGFGTGFTQSRVETLVQQPNGKLLVGGWFTEYDGAPSRFIARLNLDGSIDNSFNIGSGFTGFSGYVKAIALQPDGKVVVGGNFTGFNGETRHRIARLNSDGSLDLNFPLTGFNSDVNTIAIQPDGKIIVAGVFSEYDWQNSGGISRPRIARLHPDGSLDTSFDPQLGFVSTTGAQARIQEIILQPDGKILACGQFDEFNGISRIIIARLNPDGSLDTSFDAGDSFQLNFGFYGEGSDMALLSNGQILLAGSDFSHLGANNSGVVRLNADGSIDPSFVLNRKATALGIQPDGKILISENGPYNFNRFHADGTSDVSFPQTVFNDIAQSIYVQSDGNILIGGWFSYNPTGIMRLIGDSPSTSLDSETSTQELIHVYPNPATTFLVVQWLDPNYLGQGRFILRDGFGKLVLQVMVNANISKIPLIDLPTGLYLYQIEDDQGLTHQGKVIIR